jgi:WD40-like Beta Propeller Repeat
VIVRSIISGLALLSLCACAHHDPNADDDGVKDSGPVVPDAFAGPFSDFPGTPIIDPTGTAPPGDAQTLFGDPTTGTATGGPCLFEPEVGTVYPRNWIRPRFTWIPTAGENLYELRITTTTQVNPLIVYTTATQWTMPADLWTGLQTHSVNTPLTVSIRGAAYDGTMLTTLAHGSSGDIAIAPVDAPGAIVYWTTTGGTRLRGFKIGDEQVKDIITPTDAGSKCVGCHSSTPDGNFVGFSSSQNPNNGDPTTLGLLSSDGTHTAPTFITPSATTLMTRVNQEQPVFTKMHWQDGDHTAVTMYPTGGRFEMIWTDLEASSTAQGTGWDIIARTGDTTNATQNGAAYASFAHTSDTLLYVSSTDVASGVTVDHGNLMTVPYNNRAGGTPTAIPGAATSTFNEYYPTFSPDDTYVAYNRVADNTSSYNNSQAEVWIIPTAGSATPTRIAANDPPACTAKVSPGVTNSWPKWAPGASDDSGKRYYWLTFSSTRATAGNPQLYVTPVVDDGTQLVTYPALYLWNQPATENNHTPAWDNFSILQ